MFKALGTFLINLIDTIGILAIIGYKKLKAFYSKQNKKSGGRYQTKPSDPYEIIIGPKPKKNKKNRHRHKKRRQNNKKNDFETIMGPSPF